MFKSNLASYPYVSPVNSYTENLGRAARNFIAALLAFDPAETCEPRSAEFHTTEEDTEKAFAEMDQLAREFDTFMPNQAAELRHLMSRS